ncbi:MAG: gamma carbonic anhydrase family protein [Coriobacteriales bacterium]|jgi:carbonic anhydrase/acetyltransferase-like protein (isoleucine patch superfamily)
MANVDDTVFQALGSAVTGDVTIGAESSLWYNAVVRGDEDKVEIGKGTNIQDNATVHMEVGHPVKIGSYVSVGHNAIVHGCTIGDNTLIGMGSIIMDDAVIGKNCIIGAGALVTHGTKIPSGSMAFGSPAKVVRQLTPEEIKSNKHNAELYIDLARDARTVDLIDAVSPTGE